MYKSAREKFLGLTLESSRKSYYPQLKMQLEAARENERRLQLLIDNIPARISFVDRQERFVFINREYEKDFGLKRSQIIGRRVSRILGADNYAIAKPYIDDALRGRLVHYEAVFLTVRKERQYLDLTYVPDRNNAGNINGFYVLAIDLTEKRQTEETLKHKDLLLREIGHIAKIGGWEFDPSTGEGTWTDEVANIHDLNPDDPTNVEKGLSFIHGEHRKRITDAIQSAVEEGRSWDLELELISAKKIHKWVRTIGKPTLQDGKVVQIRGSFQDISDQKRSEQDRLASEERFRLLVESAPDAIVVQTKGLFTYVNSAAVTLFGAQDPSDLIGRPVSERFHPDFRKTVEERIEQSMQKQHSVPTLHEVCLRMDGSPVNVEASAIPMNYKGKEGALVFIRDISARLASEKEQKELEDQLHQAQKMESVGRLAGGVAHDYNNFLSVIIGYAELSLLELKPGQQLHKNLKEILNAANRSKAVTRQLLAFARKEAIAPVVLDLNTVVENMLKILRRLIGENIGLVWQPKAGLWPIEMDPSQIDQILANLCVNARDAIKNVGEIFISTHNVSADENFCGRHPGIKPGDFVALHVRDTGCGMDKETSDKIFEPFFTTKEMGKGTGLGLATVYGIVRQNNGTIQVCSEPGTGTTFKLYLPRYIGRIRAARKRGEKEIPLGRGEKILVVEDETSILTLTQRLLDQFGYRVFAMATPGEAIEWASYDPEDISLLITDVIMPEMNGRELVQKLQLIFPDLKYLYMSGYTSDVIADSGVLESGVHFLQKPFSPNKLAKIVREVLDSVNA